MENKVIIDENYNSRDELINKKYSHLNDEQFEAVISENLNSCIVACPGSGKTTTLLSRVDYLINFGPVYKTNIPYESKVSPINIIVITFTKAAANNMKKRFLRSNKQEISPFFGTFHGLFYKILQREKGRINIIQGYESFNLIKSKLSSVKDEINDEEIKTILNDISSFKKSKLNIDFYEPHVSKDIFLKCFTAYEEFKNENNKLDFEDLQLKVRDLFENDERVLNKYRKQFKYILIDEFQDCDDIQVDILKKLSTKDNSIFAVGDEDQCIYSFRGSKPEYMVNFDNIFPNSKKYYLTINYRCPKDVINISNKLIKNNLRRNHKRMDSYNTMSQGIDIFGAINENNSANHICKEIQNKVNNSQEDYGDFAILFRTNMESRSLIDVLYSNKIPFQLMDKTYNFYDNFVCKDLLAYLSLSINPYSKENFLRIINKPFRYISGRVLNKVKNAYIDDNLFDYLVSAFEMPNFQIKKINELKRDINNLNRYSLSSAIDTIINELHYYDYLVEYSEKMKIPIEELISIMDEFKLAASEHKKIGDFLTHIEDISEEIKNNNKVKNSNLSENKVVLSTIHGVKGMEFKNVIIINCNEDNIPHSNALEEGNIEEERRLFYVAITRAKEKLYLGYTNEIRGVSKKVSRFIKECDLSEVDDIAKFKKGDEVQHRYFGKGEIVQILNGIVKIKFQDSSIRSFKEDILINNGIVRKI